MTGVSPMLQAAKLWEKTSAAGNTYLIGRLGGVRILIFRNRDAGADGEPDWHLFFADGASADQAAKPAKTPEPRRRSALSARHLRGDPQSPPEPRPFNDEIPI